MSFKKLIPKNIKLKFRLIKNFLSDTERNFATQKKEDIPFLHSIETIQEIMPGTFFENKVHNLKIASCKLETIIINSNEVFSFWKIIGAPSQKNGYKTGRNIVNGKISEEIGGGLCQLSSVLYITALKANLEIIERHNHSVDIYKEHERFTPLGSDATVVYGYKDLRLKNEYDFPIRFNLSFTENTLTCKLESLNKIEEKKLSFVRTYHDDKVEVSTLVNNIKSHISTYKIKAL